MPLVKYLFGIDCTAWVGAARVVCSADVSGFILSIRFALKTFQM